MPLLLGLEALEPLIIGDALALADTLEHVLNTGHHTLETTEVDVSTGVKLGEDLVSVLLNLVLNVHLSTVLVLLLTGKSVVEAEVVGVGLLGGLELVIVEEGVRVRDAKEEPGKALVDLPVGRLLDEETAEEAAVRRDTSMNATAVGNFRETLQSPFSAVSTLIVAIN